VNAPPLQCEPTVLHWPTLLRLAAAHGAQVWHIDRTGQLVEVEAPPPMKTGKFAGVRESLPGGPE
jgi:hypothetical protein